MNQNAEDTYILSMKGDEFENHLLTVDIKQINKKGLEISMSF